MNLFSAFTRLFCWQTLLAVLLGCSGLLQASSAQSNAPGIDLNLLSAAELKLEARQAPLGQVLTEIARQAGIVLHFADLPGDPVTVQCLSNSLQHLLDCLLQNQNAKLITRYAQPGQAVELWLLQDPARNGIHASYTDVPVKTATSLVYERLDRLMAKLKDKDPAQRANAIMQLIGIKHEDDPAILNTVKEAVAGALQDKDPSVRGQTLTTLIRVQGEEATGAELEQALNDDDAQVRLMAVAGAGTNRSVLEQALSNADERVRTLAEKKLARLPAEPLAQ